MADLKLSYIYEALDKFSPTVNKVQQSVVDLNTKIKQQQSLMAKSQGGMSNFFSKFSSFGTKMTLFATGPLALIGKKAIDATRAAEISDKRFEAWFKNKTDADAFLGTIDELVYATGAIQDAKMEEAAFALLKMGKAAEDIPGTLEFLGDIAIGSGRDITSLAQGMMKFERGGALATRTLLEMERSGIPVIKELSKRFNRSEDDIKKMAQAGKIKGKELETALRAMTMEGGRFEGQMAKSSETVSAKMNNLNKAIAEMFEAFGFAADKGGGLQSVIMGITNGVKWLTAQVSYLAEHNPALLKMIGIFGGMLLSVGPLIKIFTSLAAGVKIVTTTFAALKVATLFLSAAAAANPIGLAVIAIAGAFILLNTYADEVTATLNYLWESVMAGVSAIMPYVEKLGKMLGIVSDESSSIGHFGTGAGFMGPPQAQMGATNSIHASLDVGLRDPGGMVQSMKVDKGTFDNMNVGPSMGGM